MVSCHPGANPNAMRIRTQDLAYGRNVPTISEILDKIFLKEKFFQDDHSPL
jgi:hypothetical protein